MDSAVSRLVALAGGEVRVSGHTRTVKGKTVQVDEYTRSLRTETETYLAHALDRLSTLPEDRMKKSQIINEFRRRGLEPPGPDPRPKWQDISNGNEDDEAFTAQFYEKSEEMFDLNDDDMQGYHAYVSTGFYNINRHLRGHKIDIGQTGDVERLDRVFEKHGVELEEDRYVFRAADATEDFRPDSLKPGNALLEKAFLSTSYDFSVTQVFGSWKFKILAPKGSRYLPGIGGDGGEKELLFARDSVLEVTSIDPYRKMIEAVLR